MALLSAMPGGARTINRWCPSQLQIRIAWLFCSMWSLFDNWWRRRRRRRRRRKTTYRPAAGFAAGKNGHKLQHTVQFECSRHWKPFSHPFMKFADFPLLIIMLFGIITLIRDGPPVWKWGKWKIPQNNLGSKDSTWSSSNTPGTGDILSHPFVKLENFHFLIICSLGL